MNTLKIKNKLNNPLMNNLDRGSHRRDVERATMMCITNDVDTKVSINVWMKTGFWGGSHITDKMNKIKNRITG